MGILLYANQDIGCIEDLRQPLIRALKATALLNLRVDGIAFDVADDPVRQTYYLEELMLFGMSSRLLSLESTWESIKLNRLDNAARERLKVAVGNKEFFIKICLTPIPDRDIGHSSR